MRSIKLTLSTDPKMRSPSASDEARWLRSARSLKYQLHRLPLHAAAGDWVYFIREGRVVARARAQGFTRREVIGRSYRGVAQGTLQ